MDIAMVLEQIGDAKELVQSVIEAEALVTDAGSGADRCRRALQPARAARAVRSRGSVIARATRSSDARSPSGCCRPTSRVDRRRADRRRARARARCRIPTSPRSSMSANTTAASTWRSSSRKGSRCAPRWRAADERPPRGRARHSDRRRRRRRACARLRARRAQPRLHRHQREGAREDSGVRAGVAERVRQERQRRPA